MKSLLLCIGIFLFVSCASIDCSDTATKVVNELDDLESGQQRREESKPAIQEDNLDELEVKQQKPDALSQKTRQYHDRSLETRGLKTKSTIVIPRVTDVITPCQLKRQKALANKNIGQWVPKCEKDGSFKKTQCHASTGFCFCVFPETGENVLGTNIHGKPKTCELTVCMLQRHNALSKRSFGVYVPQCEADGSFTPRQSDDGLIFGGPGSFCVFPETGEEIVGTHVYTFINVNLPTCKVTPCVLKRHQLNSPLLTGRWPPRCEEDGSFSKMQSNDGGYSYCVMPETGNKVLGTEVRFRNPKTCELTVCMLQRHKAMSENRIGNFIPQCDDDGSFKTVQFWASNGDSFCVNETGVKLPGTDVKNGKPSCDPAIWNSNNPDCQQALNSWTPIPGGLYKPACQKNNPKLRKDIQCRDSTDYCFCVFTESGEEILGTNVKGGKPKSCKITTCLLKRHEALKNAKHGMVGQFIPECQADGSFAPTQNWTSTGVGFCVFSENGEKVLGTEVSHGKPKSCELTVCMLKRHEALTLKIAKPGMVGQFIPGCQADGYFALKQIWPSVRDSSFCVFPGSGERIKVNPKSCKLTPCLLQRHKALSKIRLGKLIPQCGADGSYSKTQYDGSTGYSYCVLPETGVKVRGTEIKNGKPFNCDLTVCMHQRSQALSRPMPGRYAPKCWINGAFIAAQCSGSIGQCFCVNYAGEPINGTYVRNGPPPCVNPASTTKPPTTLVKKLTACQKERQGQLKAAQIFGSSFGFPVVRCDANGNYAKLQCPIGQICYCADPITGKATSGINSENKLHCK